MTAIEQLMNRRTVEAITGLSRATIYRLIKQGIFPKPLRIAPGRVAWKPSDIRDWMEQL